MHDRVAMPLSVDAVRGLSLDMSCLPSKSSEFFWIDNDTDHLNLLVRHIYGQDSERVITSPDDQGSLAVDFLKRDLVML